MVTTKNENVHFQIKSGLIIGSDLARLASIPGPFFIKVIP